MDLEACILNSPLLEQSAESMKSTANCRPISIAGYCKDLALHLIGVSHPNIKSWLGTEFLETDLATLIDNNRKNHGLNAAREEEYWGNDSSPGQYFRFAFHVHWRCASDGLRDLFFSNPTVLSPPKLIKLFQEYGWIVPYWLKMYQPTPA